MHMADALLSPAVGGVFWAASAGTVAYCAGKLRDEADDRRIPLMGVLGAFIFAAQMVNFAIPGTGSSGHLAGGLLLTILLGPHAAFLVLASVLLVQALFFADGGLLALGCNIFNLGFLSCFVAYPLIFGWRRGGLPPGGRRLSLASIAAAMIALQLGAFSVVAQTVLSGISELPFRSFLLMMLPIHLPIGMIEGIITAAVIGFLWRRSPEILQTGPAADVSNGRRRIVLAAFLAAALLMGGVFPWFASSRPDGLEWAVARVSGAEIVPSSSDMHAHLADLQKRSALLPDYDLPAGAVAGEDASSEGSWPAIAADTSAAGVTGGLLTLAVLAIAGMLLKRRDETVRSEE